MRSCLSTQSVAGSPGKSWVTRNARVAQGVSLSLFHIQNWDVGELLAPSTSQGETGEHRGVPAAPAP